MALPIVPSKGLRTPGTPAPLESEGCGTLLSLCSILDAIAAVIYSAH
jgi:hypothetical protein